MRHKLATYALLRLHAEIAGKEVGPVELAEHDTTYRHVAIRDERGTLQDFAMVHAIPELSGLVKPDASGTFLFLNGPDGCRLCFVYSDDGPRGVDFEAVREYFERAAA